MAKIIFALTGPIASGKGTVKKYIQEKYGGQDCRFSTVLRDVLDRVGVVKSRENMQKISTILRQAFGEDLLAETIAKDASKLEADIVIVDGVRRMADIKKLKEINGFVLIAIDATSDIRYKRMLKRNENLGDIEKSYEDFLADHKAESDKEVPVVMKNASEFLDNNGSVEELLVQVDKIIKKYHSV